MSDAADGGRPMVDPIAMARRDLKRALPRRFYKDAAMGPVRDGFAVLLDGKPVRTPAKAALVVPSQAIAEALAAEWRAQGDIVEPDTMPLTRLVNSALDGVGSAREATIAEIAKFAETDLVCYRADEPDALVAAQAAAWDPVLAFAEEDLGARFVPVTGIVYSPQSEAARLAILRRVEATAKGPGDVLRLAALSVATSLTGSVLLALALARGQMTTDAVWHAAHVDEDFQIATWGDDAEAADRRRRRRRDMDAAAFCFVAD